MTKLSIENNSDYLTLTKEPLIMISLVLVLMNIFNVAIYFCFLFIPIAILVYRNDNYSLDYNFVLICLFSFFYPVFLLINGVYIGSWSLAFGYFILPPVFYFLGYYIVRKYPSPTTIYFLLFFVCFCFSILPFFANLRSVVENGFMTERNIRMFWMEEGQFKTATGIGSYFAINMALLPLIFTPKVSNSEKKLAIFSIFLFAIAIFSTLNMSNRTGLFITIVSLLCFTIIPQKYGIRYFLFFVIFVIGMVLLYLVDAWGIRSWFENSFFYARLTQTNLYEEESRFITWGKALRAIFEHPFGLPPNFQYNLGDEFAHNLWLDVGIRAGIIPLIPLLILTISLLFSVVKIAFDNKYSPFLRILIAASGIAFYTTFFLEPVMEGLFIMFFLYCFYFGIVVAVRSNV